MGYIGIDKLKPGMVLSEDVKDINGRLLLPEGKTLENQHMRILKMWGITEVHVDGNQKSESDPNSSIPPELLENAKNATIPWFQKLDMTNPAMRELFRQSIFYQCREGKLRHMDPPDNNKEAPPACAPLSDWRQYLSKREIKLPTSPGIVVELNEVISNPYAVADDISRVVNKSPSLAAALLKIVNSAFYGFPSRIDSISRAVTLIGTREIKSLALGISVMNAFKNIANNFVNMDAFVTHSLACGVVSRIIATRKNIAQTEQMFVSGLLHDIGKLIIYKYYPNHAANLFYQAHQSGTALYNEEKKLLGTRHSRIGSYLLEKWKLPVTIVNNVRYHHMPASSPNPVQASVIHIADVIVNGFGIGNSGERCIPHFDNTAWDHLDLSTNVFKSVITQALHQLSAFESVMNIKS